MSSLCGQAFGTENGKFHDSLGEKAAATIKGQPMTASSLKKLRMRSATKSHVVGYLNANSRIPRTLAGRFARQEMSSWQFDSLVQLSSWTL